MATAFIWSGIRRRVFRTVTWEPWGWTVADWVDFPGVFFSWNSEAELRLAWSASGNPGFCLGVRAMSCAIIWFVRESEARNPAVHLLKERSKADMEENCHIVLWRAALVVSVWVGRNSAHQVLPGGSE